MSAHSDDGQPDALSVGAVFGGTESIDEAWRPDTQIVMQEVATLREGVKSPLNVNVVFHFDGHLLPPVNFEGVRTGTFRRRTMHLMVQAAVPTDTVGSKRTVLIGLLRAAVAEAEAYARRRGIADHLQELRGIVDAMPGEEHHP